jgi:hypothetical protein
MLGNGVDHLFCNEEEALEWAGSDRLDIAVAELKDIARSVNVTLGARGSLVIDGHDRWEVPGFPVTPIDTNGAGDIYAGACLAGWTTGMPVQVAARFGNFAARLIRDTERGSKRWGLPASSPTSANSDLSTLQAYRNRAGERQTCGLTSVQTHHSLRRAVRRGPARHSGSMSSAVVTRDSIVARRTTARPMPVHMR